MNNPDIEQALGRWPDFIVGDTENPYLLRWFIIPRNRQNPPLGFKPVGMGHRLRKDQVMTIDKVINEQKSRYEMLKKIPAHSINPDQVGFVALYEELATMLTDTNVAQPDNDINVVIKDNHQKNAPINCPLCDGEATVSTNEYESHYRAFVECPRCPCITSGIHQQKQYAISETIAKWNTRAKNTPATSYAAASSGTNAAMDQHGDCPDAGDRWNETTPATPLAEAHPASLNEQAEPQDAAERGDALDYLYGLIPMASISDKSAGAYEFLRAALSQPFCRCQQNGAGTQKPFSGGHENGLVYNPATHILIAREDVPEGLENSVSNTKDFCLHEGTCDTDDIEAVWKAAALIAQKSGE